MVTASDPLGGHLAGMVSRRASQYGPNAESQGWNIGVSLKPQYRGAGIGTAAHRLLVGHLFATTDVLRLEAGTDITNAPERAVLTTVGFRLEGVLRGAQYRRGAYHDMAIYGLLRSDHVHPAT
jgi:RimJ/RimL family protein N-acetyltransferase